MQYKKIEWGTDFSDEISAWLLSGSLGTLGINANTTAPQAEHNVLL